MSVIVQAMQHGRYNVIWLTCRPVEPDIAGSNPATYPYRIRRGKMRKTSHRTKIDTARKRKRKQNKREYKELEKLAKK